MKEFESNNDLGGLNLEGKYKKFYAFAPKMYGAIFEDGSSFSKVKGYKGDIDIETLEQLSNKDVSLSHSLLSKTKRRLGFRECLNIRVIKTIYFRSFYSEKNTYSLRDATAESDVLVVTKPQIILDNIVVSEENNEK